MIEDIETPRGLFKVDNPDHPFTYDGPDILLSNNKGLLAIFKIRENEYNNSNRLFVRVINSMIAYPPWTKMLLLIERESKVSSDTLKIGKFYFDKLLESNDLRKANLIINDKKSDNDIKAIMQIQKQLFRVQSEIQNDNLKYLKKVPSKNVTLQKQNFLQEKRVKFYDQISQKEITTKANIYRHENQLFGNKKLTHKASDLVELQPYYEFSIRSEFTVDNGVPYIKDFNRKALIVNQIPSAKYDPFKPLRIASLFGWHLVISDDLEEIKNRISRFKNQPWQINKIE